MISRERNNAKAINLPIFDTMAHICLIKVNRYNSFVSETLLFNQNNDNVHPKKLHDANFKVYRLNVYEIDDDLNDTIPICNLFSSMFVSF